MKLAAIVILYNPQADFINNIFSYYQYVEKLFVFDNTESKSNESFFCGLDKVEFVHDGKNEGIAKRLNHCFMLAQKQGFNWILTMDQDSCFSEIAICNYLYCIENYSNDSKVAIFGITPTDDPDKQSTKKCSGVNTPLILTSGSVLNIPIAIKLGGFDEGLFIDGIDQDFCFRAQMGKYRTIRFENIFLLHQVGELVYRASAKTLFIAKKRKWIHGPLRCYYILRNSMYLQKKYGDIFPDFINHHNFLVTKHLQRSLWYGRNFFKTLWYIQKAKRDFKNGVMGKLSNK